MTIREQELWDQAQALVTDGLTAVEDFDRLLVFWTTHRRALLDALSKRTMHKPMIDRGR